MLNFKYSFFRLKKRIEISSQELAIVRLLKEKDKRAIEMIYEHYAETLYGIIFVIVGIEQDAEDVLQETFVKVWKNGEFYNPEKGRLFTWLVNISRNTAIDKLRSKEFQKQQKIQSDESLVDIVSFKSAIGIEPEQIGLRDILENLAPKYKEIIDLFYFKGYTHQEIADEKGMPLGTVKTRLRTAIKKLRTIFKTDWNKDRFDN